MRLFLYTAFFIFALSLSPAQAQGTAPVVVELFTSQSCSSCPPADALLEEIAARPGVIALGCHVTYWDHLHWKDTLGLDQCSKRQRQYAAYRKTRRVYTPQMVVNGKTEFVGSRRNDAYTAINNMAKNGYVRPVPIAIDGTKLNISLPGLPSGSYTILIAGYTQGHVQDIPSGENRGKRVSYVNAVKSLESLGGWDGTAKTRRISLLGGKNINGYAVLAQNAATGEIVAAGNIAF